MTTNEMGGKPGPFDTEDEHDFDNLPANPGGPAEEDKEVFDVEGEHDFDDLPGTGGKKTHGENDQDAPSNE